MISPADLLTGANTQPSKTITWLILTTLNMTTKNNTEKNY